MASYRIKRVNEVLKRELASAIPKLVQTGDILLTVTDVEVTPDFRHADVYLGLVGGSPLDYNDALNRVQDVRTELQRTIARRVVLKYTPQLHFKLDTSAETGTRVVQLLDELETAERPTDG